MAFTFDNLAGFDYAPRRSATGLDIAPPRPAATASPDHGIAGFSDATARIERSTSAVYDLQADLRDAKLKLTGIDAERHELTRRVQSGHKLTAGEAARVDIERTAALANIQLITDALARAQDDIGDARVAMRSTLSRAARDFLALLRQGEEDAAAEARKARERANAYAVWGRDVSAALQHPLEVEDYIRLLGIPSP